MSREHLQGKKEEHELLSNGQKKEVQNLVRRIDGYLSCNYKGLYEHGEDIAVPLGYFVSDSVARELRRLYGQKDWITRVTAGTVKEGQDYLCLI